jgi:hypothetical protein
MRWIEAAACPASMAWSLSGASGSGPMAERRESKLVGEGVAAADWVSKLDSTDSVVSNTWEENRCRLSDRDLSCCVEPIPIGSKEQTTLPNHQSTIHCPLFRPRTSDPTASRKRRSRASRKRPTVLTANWSDRLVVLCAARTAEGGRPSEMTARLPLATAQR